MNSVQWIDVKSVDEAVTLSWEAGLVACLGSGVIELVGSVLADPLRRWLPRAALLSTLAGIGLTFGLWWMHFTVPDGAARPGSPWRSPDRVRWEPCRGQSGSR